MLISVVVPCLNRVDLTLNCLASIDEAGDQVEVVVVDNGSTDATAELDATIRNPSNLGFAKACNQGAEAAAGDVVVFLNNDTIVHPGWLNMIDRLTPEVGAVGPKLLYPDGTIQHAGVQVDFTMPPGLEAWNRLDDWTNEPTPVDAVTGACLAIRRDVFTDLGGFDEGYWNGYEDVDLCLKATHAGLVNLYDPTSVVTHLESQSGPERWAAVTANVLRLRAKWSTR